ncbi:MAG TPA: mannosyl-glycoprotein endo-beta-N-acetylglucosamidase [Phaeodactylibacter sp.]|nr:mannosyl-glycoprotein endo-beta-N-acetylglucosamidase [Phaeodactylibacter sp.]
MLIILFVLFIILKKDISFNFNLQAAGTNVLPPQNQYFQPYQEASFAEPPQYSPPPEAVKSSWKEHQDISEKKVDKITSLSLPYFQPEHPLPPKKKKKKKKFIPKIKDNRANTFANLTFILNPTYAKRKNIDREIVLKKQETVHRYIKRYADVAVAEMNKYGIPASITLAQGLLESDAGESRLAIKNNNHFGVKCFSKKCKKGHCANFTDDTHKDFFRKYKNVWDSFRAHSILLQGKRYRSLKKLKSNDYKGWARGLKKAGYATDKKYAEKLILIIETLELNTYDN